MLQGGNFLGNSSSSSNSKAIAPGQGALGVGAPVGPDGLSAKGQRRCGEQSTDGVRTTAGERGTRRKMGLAKEGAQAISSSIRKITTRVGQSTGSTAASGTPSSSRRWLRSLPWRRRPGNRKKDFDRWETTLARYLENACKMLELAHLYEKCTAVYHLLLPIYQRANQYKCLAAAHIHLHRVYVALLEANRTQSRMLGTYFRVGFYGKVFGDRLDGKEFVYKFPKITQLVEVTSRLQSLYSEQLGVPIEIHRSNERVDTEMLDPAKGFVQVTFLEPYFTSPASRATWIQRNTNLRVFRYSVPFTKPGQSFGDLRGQYKRNTLLYVRHTFPYTKTAQRVSKREESVVCPIEASTDDIRQRTENILSLLSQPRVDPNSLARLLKGSIAADVHGGPLQVCQAFLSPQHTHTPHTNTNDLLNADNPPSSPSRTPSSSHLLPPHSLSHSPAASLSESGPAPSTASEQATGHRPTSEPSKQADSDTVISTKRVEEEPRPPGGGGKRGREEEAITTRETETEDRRGGRGEREEAQQTALREIFRAFLVACAKALDVYSQLIGPSSEFHDDLVMRFETMCHVSEPLLADPKRRLPAVKFK